MGPGHLDTKDLDKLRKVPGVIGIFAKPKPPIGGGTDDVVIGD